MDEEKDWSEIESLMQERDEWKYRAKTAADYVKAVEDALAEYKVQVATLESQVRSLDSQIRLNHWLDYDRGYQAGKQEMLKKILEAKEEILNGDQQQSPLRFVGKSSEGDAGGEGQTSI